MHPRDVDHLDLFEFDVLAEDLPDVMKLKGGGDGYH